MFSAMLSNSSPGSIVSRLTSFASLTLSTFKGLSSWLISKELTVEHKIVKRIAKRLAKIKMEETTLSIVRNGKAILT